MEMLSFLDTCGIGKYFKDKTGKFQSFLFWNAIAAFGHLGNAAFSFNGASDQGRKIMYPVFSRLRRLDKKKPISVLTTPEKLDIQEGITLFYPRKVQKSQELSLFWLIIGFHLLSFSFQIILNTDYFRILLRQQRAKKRCKPVPLRRILHFCFDNGDLPRSHQ